MSKKKQPSPLVKNRLESLFAGLEQETSAPPAHAAETGQEVPSSGATPLQRPPQVPPAALPSKPPEAGPPRLPFQPEPVTPQKSTFTPAPAPPLGPETAMPIPVPSWPTSKSGGYWPQGYLAEEGSLAPSPLVLTPAGRESLDQGHLVTQAAQRPDEPSVLALALPADNEGARLLLEILDESGQRQWSEEEQQLVEQVADQLTLALENARLFQQTRQALDALAISERYQKSVAQAVALLTEAGTPALRDVLQILGEAAQASRVYYFESTQAESGQAQPDGNSWRPVSEWHAPAVPSQKDNPAVQQQYVKFLSNWTEALNIDGKISIIASDLPNPQQALFNILGIHSMLALAVPGKHAVPGLIGFDEMTYDRVWGEEEAAALQTAASALANTIAREELFAQVQTNLAEMATLYQASAELNAAQSYNQILDTLRRHTVFGNVDRMLSLSLFERPWVGDDIPDWNVIIARWSVLPEETLSSRYPLRQLPAARLISQNVPTIFEDIPNDPRLDPGTLALYQERFKTSSTIFVPLVVGGQWIGLLNGLYSNPRRFKEDEIRLLHALSVQAAVAVQNIRLIAETRRRADQLQTAAEIARDTSSTLALDDLLKRSVDLIRDRFGYYHIAIYLLDETGENAVIREAIGGGGEQMKQSGYKMPVGSVSIIGTVTDTGKPMLVNEATQDPIFMPHPLLPLTQAELCIPMKISELVIGALDVQSSQPNVFTLEDASVLQILADQIAVALDNARAYELSQKAVEEMRQIDQLKSQFLANMSHELRTPLNSIIGFSRVILKGIDGPLTELQQQDLTAIYNSGQHLLGLINDVLDVSKIEAGKMELAFDDHVSVGDLIASVMSTVIGLVKDKPIKLYKDIATDLPIIRADPMKVRQVLINLFSNAAKFTEEGAIIIRAVPHTGERGRREVKISVTDSGPGISDKDQEKLFKAFSQVDGSLTRKTGGTGLGLSICRALVEMHGGRIWVESDQQKGSTFSFTLPVNLLEPLPVEATVPETPVADQPADTPAPAADMQAPSHPEPPRETVILCIDDEQQVIKLYERYLANHGYKIVALTDPTRAVECAKEVKPFAITLDVMMSGRDGWQVLDDLKKDPATRAIPIILCTIIDNQEKGFNLGAADYLMKPILENDLLQAVQRLNGLDGQIHEVLAVDDSAEDRRWLQKAFTGQANFHLTLAEGGSQALVAMQYKRPEIIVLDLIMPDLDGFNLLETVRTDPVLQNIPVIVLTAGDLDETQRQKITGLSQGLLRKGSIKEEDLLAVIIQALEQRKMANNSPLV